MTITSLGAISLGVALPTVEVDFGLAVSILGGDKSQLELAISAGITPPSVAVNLGADMCVDASADFTAAISAGITPPSVSSSLTAVAALIADITADLDIIVHLGSLLATSGVAFYAYNGAAAGFGSAIGADVALGIYGGSGPSQTIDALIYLAGASSPGGTAIGAMFPSSSGSLSIGACLPMVNAAMLSVAADFQAKLAAFVSLQAELSITPPTFSFEAMLGVMATFKAEFEASFTLAVTPPSIDFDATFNAQLAAVEASLALFLAVNPYLDATVSAYHYHGPANGLGDAIASVAPPSGTVAGVVLATGTAATWTAMQGVFKTAA